VLISFGLPVSGSWATPDTIVHVARRADELGYHGLWTFQRLLSPVDNSAGETYRSVQDPLIALGYVAAVTRRVRLGVAIINLPFVSPVLLARQAATLDILSGGRLDLGLGLGWSPDEFTASGVSIDARGRRAEEYLAVLRTVWTDEVVSHEGEFYRIPPSRVDPKPVQRPHPPLLLGGTALPALRRAGRISDGWISSSRADLLTIGQSVAVVKRAAEAAGRDPEALRFVCRGVLRVRDDAAADRHPLTGTLAEIRTGLADLAEQGITEVFLDLNFDPRIGSPDADPLESVRRADQVLEAFAPAPPIPVV
jgi:probable F420-dependent oxidoreductase